MKNEMQQDELVCVGVVTSAHGIRGAVNIKSFTVNPKDLISYGTLFNEDGANSYDIKIVSTKKDRLIAMVQGFESRNDAETLKGLKFYIKRSALPDIGFEDEFYSDDLIGMLAINDEDGSEFGIVTAIHNYGSCDIIEILLHDSNREELVAFTREYIPEVNLEEGYIVVNLPEIEFVGHNDNSKDKS